MDACNRQLAAAYALAALPAPPAREFERHLSRCATCRADADVLADVASALALALPPVEPPPELRERIVGATGTAGI